MSICAPSFSPRTTLGPPKAVEAMDEIRECYHAPLSATRGEESFLLRAAVIAPSTGTFSSRRTLRPPPSMCAWPREASRPVDESNLCLGWTLHYACKDVPPQS